MIRTISAFYEWLRKNEVPYRRLRTLVNTEKETMEMISTEGGLIIVQEFDEGFEIYFQDPSIKVEDMKATVLKYCQSKQAV